MLTSAYHFATRNNKSSFKVLGYEPLRAMETRRNLFWGLKNEGARCCTEDEGMLGLPVQHLPGGPSEPEPDIPKTLNPKPETKKNFAGWSGQFW